MDTTLIRRDITAAKGGYVLKKQYLEAKIKTYYGNAERQKAKADRYYAAYKQTGNEDDYRQSQYYYQQAERSLELAHRYEQMLANGEYDEARNGGR